MTAKTTDGVRDSSPEEGKTEPLLQSPPLSSVPGRLPCSVSYLGAGCGLMGSVLAAREMHPEGIGTA